MAYTDPVGIKIQADELVMAAMVESDFDLAYRLQLEEALQASRSLSPSPMSASAHPSMSPSHQDRALACSMQTMELSMLQQVVNDRRQVEIEEARIQHDLKLRFHDLKFAQNLYDLNDSDWESHGDLCEDPFDPSLDEVPALKCSVYVTAVTSGEGESTVAAVGATILDWQGNPLTEISKPLEDRMTKGTADYIALIVALEAVFSMGLKEVEAFTDSVLVYSQVMGRWPVRTWKQQGLVDQVSQLYRKLQDFTLNLIPRNENSNSVQLARRALNSCQKQQMDQEICIICFEGKYQSDMCTISGCCHKFCLSCVVQHAEAKVQSGQVPVRCPQVECKQTLSLDQCKYILSSKWFDLLNKRLVEAQMPEAERVYCPFSNCSALMSRSSLIARDKGIGTSSSSTAALCTECYRYFCMECRVPWHIDMSCEEYQNLPPAMRDVQEAKLQQLAKHQKWQRCKKCRRMIELAEGCYHMTCRCGYEFCYVCGEPWKDKQQACKCKLWDERYLLNEPLSDNDEDEAELESEYDYDERSEDTNQSNAIKDNPYYKTQLCRYYPFCRFGENCRFAHGVQELRSIF